MPDSGSGMVYNIMPTYIFECYEQHNGCGHTFELTATMAEASSLKPKCPSCKKGKPVARNYGLQGIAVMDKTPHTVGELADQNASRLSADEKVHLTKKHTAYKDLPFTGSLPEGASQYPVDSSGQKIPSRKQYQSDPKKKPKKKQGKPGKRRRKPSN